MKVIIVLCVVLGAALGGLLTDEQRHKLLDMHNECAKETGVDESLVTQAIGGNFAEDDKFKAQVLCFSKKIGFQDDGGNIQEDAIKAKLSMVIGDEGKVDGIVSTCAHQKDTPENTAFDLMKCFHEEKKKLH